MSQESTVPILYLAFCGNFTGIADNRLWDFYFVEQAPASICQPHTITEEHKYADPDPIATKVFIKSLIDRHNEKILYDRTWQCVKCNKPAEELLHATLSFLSPNAEVTAPNFVPKIIDYVLPICELGGACCSHAEKCVKEFAKVPMRSHLDVSKSCENAARGPRSNCAVDAGWLRMSKSLLEF